MIQQIMLAMGNTNTGGNVVFDAASQTSFNGVSTIDLPITCTNTETTGFLAVAVSIWSNSSQVVSSVVRDGASFSVIGSFERADGTRIEMWGLETPSVGANDAVITLSDAAGGIAGAASFRSVNQITPTAGWATAEGADSNPTITFPSAAGEYVLDIMGSDPTGGTEAASDAGQTEIWNAVNGGGDIRGGGSYKAGAASVTMDWELTIGGSPASKNWVIGAVRILPA